MKNKPETVHRGFRIPADLDKSLVRMVKYPQTLTDVVVSALKEWMADKKKK